MVKTMRKPDHKLLIASVIFLLFGAISIKAQEASKIDEINNPRCDLSEVPPIDPAPYGKFATAMRDHPEFRGAIVLYGLEGNALAYAKDVRERFNNVAGVAKERLLTIYGGSAEGSRMELWVIPKGAAEPKPTFVRDVRKASMFASYGYWNGEMCSNGRESALSELGEALQSQPGWQGYIILRLHRNKRVSSIRDKGWDTDGHVSHRQALWRLTKDKNYLIRKFSLDSMRLKAIVGDKDMWTHAELWLVPPGTELPMTKAMKPTK